MLSIIQSMGLHGLDGYLINVEVDVSAGMPSFDVVGLPDVTVKESKERVRTAIKNSELNFESRKIIVNLSDELKKIEFGNKLVNKLATKYPKIINFMKEKSRNNLNNNENVINKNNNNFVNNNYILQTDVNQECNGKKNNNNNLEHYFNDKSNIKTNSNDCFQVKK